MTKRIFKQKMKWIKTARHEARKTCFLLHSYDVLILIYDLTKKSTGNYSHMQDMLRIW